MPKKKISKGPQSKKSAIQESSRIISAQPLFEAPIYRERYKYSLSCRFRCIHTIEQNTLKAINLAVVKCGLMVSNFDITDPYLQ